MTDFSKFDKSKFNTLPYSKKIDKPWGYEIHWVPEDRPYLGKIEHIEAGKRMSLQIHDQKQESWFLMNGRAKIVWEDQNGNMVETEMESGKGYACSTGQKHRLCGITDCDIIEVSTPEIGTTFRLEDDYERIDETPEQRKLRDQGKL